MSTTAPSITGSPRAFPRVRAAINSEPWNIKPDILEAIAEIAEAHAAGAEMKPFVAKVLRGRRCPDPECHHVLKAVMRSGATGQEPTGEMTCPNCGCTCQEDDLPPYEIINGVAILQLVGPLFPKANLFTALSGATSYQQFAADFSHAVNNPDVHAIVIEADSPGGACKGMAELCSRVFAARDQQSKPIIGMIDAMAASAAYAVISQCDRVVITESGIAGSIGTVSRYSNWERAERNAGNDPVMIMSAELKAFGIPETTNQYQSLIKTVQAYFEQFKDIVARARPVLEIDKVATGDIWVGKAAVSAGLADSVATFDEVLADLAGEAAA